MKKKTEGMKRQFVIYQNKSMVYPEFMVSEIIENGSASPTYFETRKQAEEYINKGLKEIN